MARSNDVAHLTQQARDDGGTDEGTHMPPELDREQQGGPSDYDESGGTGLEPRPGDQVIGGGVSGGDDDPIGEPGIPDEVNPRLDD